MTQIWGRPVGPDGKAKPNAAGDTPWLRVGTTCLPDAVPGRPTLGMATIRAAFHDTAFARARVLIQPEGNVTLVNLATFFRVQWDQAGFQPGEVDAIDPARMLGYRVAIRPTLVGYRYVFGDGVSSAPTRSAGGVYPGGDVRHTYTRRGQVTARVEVTFGGEFRLGDGSWLPIDDTVTVAMPGTRVSVREARAVLVNQ
ncbi:hypothetical protein [Intrasporangium sp.]|uniref:hypothetical protein n=1 Tax=Intrasporangium sp. TaxID=1925024 RepID=UPI003221EA17